LEGSPKRRSPFAESQQRVAKEAGLELSKRVEFDFRRRYNLPPNDPRFLELTFEDILTDWWAHRYTDDPKLAEEVVDEDFDPDDVARQIGAEVELPPYDDWEELK
jgi:hypothetical protein